MMINLVGYLTILYLDKNISDQLINYRAVSRSEGLHLGNLGKAACSRHL